MIRHCHCRLGRGPNCSVVGNPWSNEDTAGTNATLSRSASGHVTAPVIATCTVLQNGNGPHPKPQFKLPIAVGPMIRLWGTVSFRVRGRLTRVTVCPLPSAWSDGLNLKTPDLASSPCLLPISAGSTRGDEGLRIKAFRSLPIPSRPSVAPPATARAVRVSHHQVWGSCGPH